ncbi:pilus assembly protein PilO [Yersinia sp. Marseille-Q3913]|uniref:pilus assembly protein PilO n=1 Tax=Yersinia sp. Marseille-Q3913 TaxID=2830769 RepID=UPI001BAED622|nr:pilus assembly protein PilO [Yersinia sp. Marseille-Q3913]MBS0056668.1 pilus assembly protein PilO [Yersinia sp. Marseille-Q3913]
MNNSLQRWLDRPGWQLCLWQWGILGLLGAAAYGMLLRPAWQQQHLSENKIIQHQQQVEDQQSLLATLPALSLIRQQIAAVRSEEAVWRQNNSSMAHLVGELIAPFGGQVIYWQRQSEPAVVAEPDAVAHQQWHATLRVNFYGLLHLLRQLSEISGPVQTQLIEVKNDNAVLMVKISLKEYLVEGINESLQ